MEISSPLLIPVFASNVIIALALKSKVEFMIMDISSTDINFLVCGGFLLL